MPIELAQFIAYVALTMTGITVAIVSLRFSYRQNVGWQPILMVTGQGLKSGFVDESYIATLNLEFWNRGKYPVVVRHIFVDFTDMDFLPEKAEPTSKTGWYIKYDGTGVYSDDFAIEGSGHKPVEFEAPFAKRSLDDLSCEVKVSLTYFDPRLSKNCKADTEFVFRLNGL